MAGRVTRRGVATLRRNARGDTGDVYVAGGRRHIRWRYHRMVVCKPVTRIRASTAAPGEKVVVNRVQRVTTAIICRAMAVMSDASCAFGCVRLRSYVRRRGYHGGYK